MNATHLNPHTNAPEVVNVSEIKRCRGEKALDTPRSTRRVNTAAAVAMLIAAMWSGYTNIGLPPVVIVGGSGLVAFAILTCVAFFGPAEA